MNLNLKDVGLKFYCRAKALVTEQEGATAIEYAVIAGLIAVVIIAGARVLGTDLNALFNSIAGQIP
ncbi:Flp family type IVb pilin [Pseudomonas sp. CAN2814]|uniref:Flp family type IVb pilin n=1 Tax=Pseudomonas sp. CAN1 TaxID=3046726 RepID=UPI00264859FF|nr:Flp family type IVb pilin [Pseudomonas sp. CAN1]MDN6859363.1 Flp family type IVb pilin [Pseudomonas sp. CAN1]